LNFFNSKQLSGLNKKSKKERKQKKKRKKEKKKTETKTQRENGPAQCDDEVCGASPPRRIERRKGFAHDHSHYDNLFANVDQPDNTPCYRDIQNDTICLSKIIGYHLVRTRRPHKSPHFNCWLLLHIQSTTQVCCRNHRSLV
jgi:hypothetical protein